MPIPWCQRSEMQVMWLERQGFWVVVRQQKPLECLPEPIVLFVYTSCIILLLCILKPLSISSQILNLHKIQAHEGHHQGSNMMIIKQIQCFQFQLVLDQVVQQNHVGLYFCYEYVRNVICVLLLHYPQSNITQSVHYVSYLCSSV